MVGVDSLQKDIQKSLLENGGLTNVDADIVSRCKKFENLCFSTFLCCRLICLHPDADTLPIHLPYEGAALVSTVEVTPNQLADCWAAFSLNKNVQSLDATSFDSFRSHIIKEYNSRSGFPLDGAVMTRDRKRQPNAIASVTPPSKKAVAVNNDTKGSSASRTNFDRRVSVSPPETTRPKFSERKDSGKVLDSFNPKNLQIKSSSWPKSSPRCKISYSEFDVNQNTTYRHYFTTIDDRSKALNDQLEEMKDIMVEHYDLELEAVGVARPSKICCVGRINNAVRCLIAMDCETSFLDTN